MRTEFQNWLNGLTNDDGSGTTGDLLNISWFDIEIDTIDGVLDDIDADIAALQAIGFVAGFDSVLYSYKDADTITIAAGGQFTTSDNTAFITVAAATDIKISTGRSSDCAAEAANTLYYLWGGRTSLGATAFYFHTSSSAMPSELVKGKRIRGAVRNDNSSNIIEFRMTDKKIWYVVDADCQGSDTTEVLDATVSTSFVDVDCSGFVPAGIREVIVSTRCSASVSYVRDKNSSLSAGITLRDTTGLMVSPFYVNATGVFQIKNSTSVTTRASIISYAL